MCSRNNIPLVGFKISQQEADEECGISADIFPVAFEECDTSHNVKVHLLLVVCNLMYEKKEEFILFTNR